MLNDSQISEIKGFLDRCERPLFFFDDDCDGLCSYMLLRKHVGMKGYGVCLKNKPILESHYVRKVDEYCPDLIVVLDKPIVSQDFLDGVSVPVIWIDHHQMLKRERVHYYNSKVNDRELIGSTSYMAWEICRGELWVAMAGALADYHISDFADEFIARYPGLMQKTNSAADALFGMKIGELIRIMNFLLKGTTTSVRRNVEALLKVESPQEILDGTTPRGKFLLNRVEKVLLEYDKLLKRAMKEGADDKGILLFVYENQKNSFTAELSGELLYRLKPKLVVVGRRHGDEVKLSLRSSVLKLPGLVSRALAGVKGYGGGHDPACGACVAEGDFEVFMDNLRGMI